MSTGCRVEEGGDVEKDKTLCWCGWLKGLDETACDAQRADI